MASEEYPLPPTLTPAYSMAAPAPMPSGNPDWRATGNLRGEVPVREEFTPPNLLVIEDEELYRGLRMWAQNLAFEQRLRADELAGNDDDLPEDHRYWFAESYYRVSHELIAAAEAGKFYYPSFVMLSIVYFDAVYRENFARFAADGECEPHWEVAFKIALGDWLVPMRRSLPAGVADAALGLFNLGRSAHAHLRFDLCRALAWVYSNHYPLAGFGGDDAVTLDTFSADFFSMGEVFDAVTDQVKEVISVRTGAPVSSVPNFIPGLDGWVNLNELGVSLAFSLGLADERQRTWDRAIALQRDGQPRAFACEVDASSGLAVPRLRGTLLAGIRSDTGDPMEFTSHLDALADPPTMAIPPSTEAALSLIFTDGVP